MILSHKVCSSLLNLSFPRGFVEFSLPFLRPRSSLFSRQRPNDAAELFLQRR